PGCLRRPPRRLPAAGARTAPASGPADVGGAGAGAAAGFRPGRHRLPPGAEVPALAARQLAGAGAAGPGLRHRLGLGTAGPAPGPRALLPALPPVPRRLEAPDAGQLLQSLSTEWARTLVWCTI